MLAKCLGLSIALISIASTVSAASLDDLVAQARKEGGLHAQIIDQAGPEGSKLAAAFSKRFGLTDVSVGGENETTAFQKAETAMRVGTAPDYDAMVGEDGNVYSFIKKGLLQKADDWQARVAAINPAVSGNKVTADQVSPGPFAGYAFLTATRVEAIVYNPRLIKEADLPHTHLDLADAKYHGKFNLPPWSTTFTLGSLIYPKDSWAQTVDAIGKNAGAVLFPLEGSNRIVQGDFAFSPMNYLYYATMKGKDPTAPIAASFFKDGVFTYRVLYGVPKGAKHPASGMLFALWMTSDEARVLEAPSLVQENIETGQTAADQEERALIKASGAKVLGWFVSPEAQSQFEWITTTDEGKKYNQVIGQGLTQRK